MIIPLKISIQTLKGPRYWFLEGLTQREVAWPHIWELWPRKMGLVRPQYLVRGVGNVTVQLEKAIAEVKAFEELEGFKHW